MRVVELGVEAVRRLVVLPQVDQRADDRGVAQLRVVRVALRQAVVAVLAEQPARPGRHVGHEHQHARGEQPRQFVEHGVAPRPAYPGRAADAHLPEQHQQRERRYEVERAPLHRAGAAEQHTCCQPPPRPVPPARRRTAGPARLCRVEPALQRPRPAPPPGVPVEHQRAERGEHEQQQEDVEDGRAGQHQVVAVEREQQAGRAAEHRGAEHPPPDTDQQQHRQRARHRRSEPPAELRRGGDQVARHRDATVRVLVAEGPLADADHPLAQRWMHHVRRAVVLVVPLEAAVDQPVRVLGVVGLVEDLPGREAEPHEAQDRRDGHHHRCRQPRLTSTDAIIDGGEPAPHGGGKPAPGAVAPVGGGRVRVRALCCRRTRHPAIVGCEGARWRLSSPKLVRPSMRERTPWGKCPR